MFRAGASKWLVVFSVITGLVLGGDAFADRHGRGGDSGRGHSSSGGGDGGGRSWSGGGGGGGGGGGRSWSGGDGGSSMRSMSSGRSSQSFSGGSSRSFSGGGEQSVRSFGGESSRSFSGGTSRSFGGGSEHAVRSLGGESSRSFSGGGGERSSRSFSGQSPRTFSEGSRSDSAISRSYQGRTSVGGSTDGTTSLRRSFGGESATSRSIERMPFSRGSGDSSSAGSNSALGQSGQSIRRSDSAEGSSNSSNWRNFSRGSNDAGQLSRSLGGDGSRGDTTSDSANAARRFQTDGSNRFGGDTNRSRVQTGDTQASANALPGTTNGSGDSRPRWSRSNGQYTGGRPTNDQVQNFLQMRRDGANQSGEGSGSGRAAGSFSRSDDTHRTIDHVTGDVRQQNIRTRLNESQNEGDRAWARRFGNGGGDRSGQLARRDGDADGPRGGNWNRTDGNANGPSGRNGSDNGRNLGGANGGGNAERSARNREFGDRDFADRNYQSWRKNAWRGERGDGHDHRDASGRWKDGDRFVAANHIRSHWKGHKNHKDVPFHGGWWQDHHGHHGDHDHHHGHHHRHWDHWDHWAHHHHRPFYWWSWCPAPRLTTWFSFGWSSPYYWDYGPGEYIYCYDDVIYVNGAWFQPAPVYYESTVVLAQRAPDLTPEQALAVEWLPLGVFAIARDGIADENVLVQLAVTKDGIMGGTVFNKATGASFDVEGTVDQKTQRAVWTYVDETNARIVMETSVYNLTQPEATGLIHYGPDNIQVVELVRLEEPSVSPATPAAQ